MGTRCMHRPRAVYPGSLRGVAAPLASLLCPCTTRHTLTGPILIPCSVVPPPRSSSSTYRILTPAFFLGPLCLVTSAYPPALLTPRLARPSYPGFTAGLWSEISPDGPIPMALLSSSSSLPPSATLHPSSPSSSLRRGAPLVLPPPLVAWCVSSPISEFRRMLSSALILPP